jgi:hypothetical protein
MYLIWTLILTADFSVYLAGLTNFDCGLFHSPNLDTPNLTTDIWIWNGAHGGCDLSAEDAHSSAAPDPTFAFVGGPCFPTLNFVIAFWIMIMFYTLLTSLFYILKQPTQAVLELPITRQELYHWVTVLTGWPHLLIDWLLTTLCPICWLIGWRRYYCQWRAEKFRPMFGAQGLWAGRHLYRATPAVTRGLGFSSLIQRTAPFSRLLWHARRLWEPVLTHVYNQR